MQTFLTSTDFSKTAAALDNQRLNKQILEGRQIMAAINGETKGWRNHPATNMWRGYEWALFIYLSAMVTEAHNRGIATDKNWNEIKAIYLRAGWKVTGIMPKWFQDPVALDRIITSHRASLYKKNPEHYAQWKFESDWVDEHRWDVVCCGPKRKPTTCNYYWPTHEEAR